MDLEGNELRRVAHAVSMLTHAHIRSQMACGSYVFIAVVLHGQSLESVLSVEPTRTYAFYSRREEFKDELQTYARLWDLAAVCALPESVIKSSGYVMARGKPPYGV